MSTHSNCQHCGTAEPVRVLIIGDESTSTVTIALMGLDRVATEVAREFALFNGAVHDLKAVGPFVTIDPSIHLAPSHQDYTPSHRKPRRGKFKRGGR